MKSLRSRVLSLQNALRLKKLIKLLILSATVFSFYIGVSTWLDHFAGKYIFDKQRDDLQTVIPATSKDMYHLTSLEKHRGDLQSPLTETPQHTTYIPLKTALLTPKEIKRADKISKTSNSVLDELYRNISMHFHLSQSDRLDPWLNLHQFKYLINADICKQNLFVLAFVHSSPYKVKERNQIRTTWGGYKVFKGKHFRTVFMLGDPQNGTIQRIIVEEAKKYKDIVQGDFKDTYRNLTYKQIMGLSWTTVYCPNVSYILKTDDDTMVNVFNMVDYLTITVPNKEFLYCSVFTHQAPFRMITKWRVSILEYPFKKYPHYCQGFAYLMTPDVAARILNASKIAKMFWIDDVFVTGILNVYTEVPLRYMIHNYSYVPMGKENIGPSIKNVMFILSRNKGMREFWNYTWNAILYYSRG